MENEQDIKRLLDINQVAARLSVSRRTVIKFRDTGFMPPAIKLGRAGRETARRPQPGAYQRGTPQRVAAAGSGTLNTAIASP